MTTTTTTAMPCATCEISSIELSAPTSDYVVPMTPNGIQTVDGCNVLDIQCTADDGNVIYMCSFMFFQYILITSI